MNNFIRIFPSMNKSEEIKNKQNVRLEINFIFSYLSIILAEFYRCVINYTFCFGIF